MRRSAKAGGLAALLVALLFVVGFAGGAAVVGAQDATATATSTPEATQAPTQAYTAQPTQQTGAGQAGQGITLDWTNIPLCVQAAATAEATAEATADMAGQATAEATAAATQAVVVETPVATLDPATTPFLGVLVSPVADCGVQVLDIFAASPAETVNLALDDVIVAVDNTLLADYVATLGQSELFNSTTTEAFFRLIRTHLPGDVITLTVQRDSANIQFVVTLGSLPEALTGQGTPAATATPSS